MATEDAANAAAAAYWLWREKYLRENVLLLQAWSARMHRGSSRFFYNGRLRPVETIRSPLL